MQNKRISKCNILMQKYELLGDYQWFTGECDLD